MTDDLGFHVPLGPWCERANERIVDLEAETRQWAESFKLAEKSIVQLQDELDSLKHIRWMEHNEAVGLNEQLTKAEADLAAARDAHCLAIMEERDTISELRADLAAMTKERDIVWSRLVDAREEARKLQFVVAELIDPGAYWGDWDSEEIMADILARYQPEEEK